MNGYHALETTIRERARDARDAPFAVVDFDNTCIVNDVTEVTLAHLCRHYLLRCDDLVPAAARDRGEFHAQVFRRYYDLLGAGDITGASLLCARVFAGFTRDEAQAVVAAAIDAEQREAGGAELHGIPIARGLAVRPMLRTLIELLDANRVQTWIVSASPDIAVRTAMQRFGLAGQLIALRHRMRGDLLSDEIEPPYSIAHGKVECIRAFIDASRRPLLGVGDSVHDLPMLEYAELRAVVNHDDGVTATARQRGWFVLEC